jgi:hypothetical protein
MKPWFRDYTLTWKEIGLLKLTLFIAGVLVGTYFAESLKAYHVVLLVALVLAMIYWIWWWARNL